jgi:hypothetical protein
MPDTHDLDALVVRQLLTDRRFAELKLLRVPPQFL